MHEVFQHRTHPPHDLDAARAAVTYFGTGEVHEVLPVRRPENEPQFTGFVEDLLTAELPQTNQPKQTVKLIDGEHGCRRIVDGWRQGLDGDIDQDSECKGRILLNSTF